MILKTFHGNYSPFNRSVNIKKISIQVLSTYTTDKTSIIYINGTCVSLDLQNHNPLKQIDLYINTLANKVNTTLIICYYVFF